MNQEKQACVIGYPELWPKPMYHFGQVVLVSASGGISRMLIVGMRLGNLTFAQCWEWQYQTVEIEGAYPSRYCDRRWHQEEALSRENEHEEK